MKLHHSVRFLLGVLAAFMGQRAPAADANTGIEVIQYHPVRTDAAGHIVPWPSDVPGIAFDHVIRLVWNFWDQMEPDRNGLPYHMNHQVWRPDLDDHRGIGGDQIQMALSSWALLHRYLGNLTTDNVTGYPTPWGRIVENMRFMADYYLYHGLSGPADAWPNLPYPYNTAVYSGVYDGDMVLGRGYTQPDKAGSLGHELVTLYRTTGQTDYLDAALLIADSLARHTSTGDATHSPLPFKVHAPSGRVGRLRNPDGSESESGYTTNWSGTLRLFEELVQLGRAGLAPLDGHRGHEDPGRFAGSRLALYQDAFDTILAWMKAHPMKTNRWGPFFEDIPGWSDTQINAVTFADFIMDHPGHFPEWRSDVRGILDWVYHELGNKSWERFGVIVVDEQTAYRVPGNSHTSRQAAAELRFAALTGDRTHRENAIRQLAWATYTVAPDGRNRYIRDDIWLTDGYGDYVRHYLRAMAAAPELAPPGQDHILDCTSVVTHARYQADGITFRTYDEQATTTLRLSWKPARVLLASDPGTTLPERAVTGAGPGWTWQPMGGSDGLMRLRHEGRAAVRIER